MTLLLVVCVLGAFFAGLSVRPVVAALEARRLPPQVFLGRVFPHPLDERWRRTGLDGSWQFAIGDLEVKYDDLWIGNVRILESDERVKKYAGLIAATYDRRIVDKALEAIP